MAKLLVIESCSECKWAFLYGYANNSWCRHKGVPEAHGNSITGKEDCIPEWCPLSVNVDGLLNLLHGYEDGSLGKEVFEEELLRL